MHRALRGAPAGTPPREQELAKQRMKLVGVGRRGQAFREVIAPDEIVEACAALSVVCQALGHLCREAREERRLHQELTHRGIPVSEHFGREVIEQRLGRLRVHAEAFHLPACRAREPQQQDQTRDPAFAPLMQALNAFDGQAMPRPDERADHGLRLHGVQAQIPPADLGELVVHADARERLGRWGPADEQEMAAARQLLQPCGDDVVETRGRRGLVHVVEHHDERRAQASIQLPEIVASEGGDVSEIFGGQPGKGPAKAGSRLRGGEAQMMEEARRIGVAGIDLIPEAGELPRLHVRGDQRRLAGACGGSDPHGPVCAPVVVKDAEQAGTSIGARNHRARELREPLVARPGGGVVTARPGAGSSSW